MWKVRAGAMGGRSQDRRAYRSGGRGSPPQDTAAQGGGFTPAPRSGPDGDRDRRSAYGYEASTTVWIPPRTNQSVVTVIRRGATAATRSSRMRLVMSSWNPPSFR